MKNKIRYLVLPLTLLVLLFSVAEIQAAQGVTENYGPVVEEIVERGDRAIANYSPADSIKAGNEFSRLYYDVFEGSGMEFTLDLKDSAAMLKIESGFSLIISQCMRGDSKAEIEKSWAIMKKDMDYAVERYSKGEEGTGFWGRVMQSFLILFREGMEAMLIVAALAAYLRRSGYGDKVKVIWFGALGALIVSAGTAWLLAAVIGSGGANQEAMEGVTMLLAAVVMLYVSYWLVMKRDADRWQAFIRDSMDRALGGGSLFALGAVSFMAVFREGAETILFYRALIGGSSGQLTAIWTGMALGALALGAMFLVVRILSIRLPLRFFFGVTSVLLFGMAFMFIGQGIFELQTSGLISANRLEGWPLISWLGVFPVRETVMGQAVVLLLLPVGWLLLRRKNNETGSTGVPSSGTS